MTEENIKTLTELEAEAQAELQQPVEPINPLKAFFIEYVGNKYKPEDGAVTVEMCVQALGEDFPEFLVPVCEQNFFLGYNQCEADIRTALTARDAAKETEASVDLDETEDVVINE